MSERNKWFESDGGPLYVSLTQVEWERAIADALTRLESRVKELDEQLDVQAGIAALLRADRDRLQERLEHEQHQRWVESGKMGDLVKDRDRLREAVRAYIGHRHRQHSPLCDTSECGIADDLRRAVEGSEK